MMGKDTSILGMTLMNATEEETADVHAVLRARMEDGTIKPITGKELPLAEAPRAHHDIIEKKAYGQIVLIP
jgi:NADPH2:quinone reductase